MHIPTCLKLNDVPLPGPDGELASYVLADNGLFLERRSSMFTASVRVNQHELNLARQEEYCQLHCGKIPRVMHRVMLAFFQSAQQFHGGEAALVLLFHPQRRVFRWHCPEQLVDVFQTRSGWRSGDLIKFNHPLILAHGFLHFGDAHLHAGSPIPSSIDVRDDQDGLHIIVGTLQSVPSYHVDFVMDGKRFRVPPASIFEDPHCQPFHRPPRSWLKQIQLRWNHSVYSAPRAVTGVH